MVKHRKRMNNRTIQPTKNWKEEEMQEGATAINNKCKAANVCFYETISCTDNNYFGRNLDGNVN